MSALTAVEVVSAFGEAFNEGGPERAVEYLSPEVEMHAAREWPGKPVYIGHAGARELAAEWMDSFTEYHWSPRTIEQHPGGLVTALLRHGGRTRDGVAVDAPLAGVFEVTDGLITKVKWFFAWENAFEAARVEEEVQ